MKHNGRDGFSIKEKMCTQVEYSTSNDCYVTSIVSATEGLFMVFLSVLDSLPKDNNSCWISCYYLFHLLECDVFQYIFISLYSGQNDLYNFGLF